MLGYAWHSITNTTSIMAEELAGGACGLRFGASCESSRIPSLSFPVARNGSKDEYRRLPNGRVDRCSWADARE
jgi:hypothetical protein